VRHPDGGQIQHGAEMNGQASLSGMILTRSVDEEHLGQPGQRGNRLRQQWTFAESQEPWLVGRTNRASRD
jgi:hypothetical protein